MNRRTFLRLLGAGGAAAGTMTIPGSHPPALVAAGRTIRFASSKTRARCELAPAAVSSSAMGTLLNPPPAESARRGRTRTFHLDITPRTLAVADGVSFDAWTFNGSAPGPILRATHGDVLKITVRNLAPMPHSVHFHGIHASNMDGAYTAIAPGAEFTYEFTAKPFGLFPYHCHVDPLDQHIGRGLYGTLIIDPPRPRPRARELVMVMNGYDINGDGENEVYSVNGVANYFRENPIRLRTGELVRVYLVNMTDLDAVNSFHLHANMFNVFGSGTSLKPSALTDIVTLGVAERAILEFTYDSAGRYMFHAHQNDVAAKGWMGTFDVRS